jgi:hypothetical protein
VLAAGDSADDGGGGVREKGDNAWERRREEGDNALGRIREGGWSRPIHISSIQ